MREGGREGEYGTRNATKFYRSPQRGDYYRNRGDVWKSWQCLEIVAMFRNHGDYCRIAAMIRNRGNLGKYVAMIVAHCSDHVR